jgi:hypothetical protein
MLALLSRELYSKRDHWVSEVIQNADDNTYPPGSTPTLTFDILEGALKVCSNEVGFSRKNVEAICSAGLSSKSRSDGEYIGEKGAWMFLLL